MKRDQRERRCRVKQIAIEAKSLSSQEGRRRIIEGFSEAGEKLVHYGIRRDDGAY